MLMTGVDGLASAPAAPFVPTDITGLQLWLDASDAATVTQTVGIISQWNDKSAAGICASVSQATVGQRPTYITAAQNGLNTVRFNSAFSQALVNGSATALRSVAGWSIFIAGSCTNQSSTSGQWYIQVSNDVVGTTRVAIICGLTNAGRNRAGGRRNNADGFASAEAASALGTAFSVISGIGSFTSTTVTLYQGGSQAAQNTSWLTSGNTPNDGGSVGIGGDASSSSNLSGDLGEILIYNSALSSGQRGQVEAYLAAKWGT